MEIVIAIVLAGVVILGSVASSSFFIKKIYKDSRRYDMLSQINYCFEDLRLRCASAIELEDKYFFSSNGEVKNEFQFEGEANPYYISPDNMADNRVYRYGINNGNFMRVEPDISMREVLINEIYQPQVSFEYVSGSEPNFMRITITAQDKKYPDINISRTEGVRFWFIDVVK